jgi:hypothetical protein
VTPAGSDIRVARYDAAGVLYAAPAALSDNQIDGNAVGVRATVNTLTGGLGFVGAGGPNEIHGNVVGVELTGRMQGQHVRDNETGVTGSGVLGGESLDRANVIEGNTVGVRFDGTVQFTRVAGNQIGVEGRSGQLLHHNLIYRNAQAGVLVAGKSHVQLVANTLYAPAGDNLRVEDGSSDVEVRNNVFWAESGYDIYVADDSQAGFFSDFNTLHASGSGMVVFWTRDFTDVLDWQADVAAFDLHSSGRTAVNPSWSEPRFVNKAQDDYRIFDTAAGLRFTSPTVDAGDPAVDLGVPAGLGNLLANPGFENGVTGWAVNPGGTVRGASPAAFQGASYFFPNTSNVGSAEQTIDLVAAGYTPAELDGSDLVAVFGGRLRSAAEPARDRGTITLTFLGAQGQVLGETVVKAANVADRWELLGGRAALPVGTRSVRFAFEAARHGGTTTDVYLDGAFLRLTGEGYAPDQGAYGHGPAEQQQSPATHIALRAPELYLDWERDRPLPIRWETYNNAADSRVRIDLYQDSAEGPRHLLTIAADAPDTGEYVWIPANSGIDFGTYGLRVQVSLVDNPAVVDRSTEPFKVPENTTTFFVNDGSTGNDQYTTAAGNNRNTGKLASAPKPLPNNLLRTYDLGPTHTLYVDTGDYRLIYTVLLSGALEVADDEGFVFTGPTDVTRTALFRHANPLTVAPLVELTAPNSSAPT